MPESFSLQEDWFLELLRSMAMLYVVIYFWRCAQRAPLRDQAGVPLVLAGFLLVLFGSVMDLFDEPPVLAVLPDAIVSWPFVGDTPLQGVLEKLVGFLFGFVLLAIGLLRWLPALAAGKSAQDDLASAHGALAEAHLELERRIQSRTAELVETNKRLEEEVEYRRGVERALLKSKRLAEKGSRSKSRFLAHMSHELRTPLNSVIGFTNRLLATEQSEPAGTYLQRIRDNGQRLVHLINQILDLEKIEAGHIDLQHVSVAVGDLVHGLAGELEAQFDQSGLELRVEVPGSVAFIEGDPAMLAQVLTNLVGNALKFTESGSVTLRVSTEGSTGRPLCIDVIDTGVGVPVGDQQAIFDPFEQVAAEAFRGQEGTGLGLAICRSLCELMGYGLELTSSPGQGSTFSVVLDAATRHDPSGSVVEEHPPGRDRLAG